VATGASEMKEKSGTPSIGDPDSRSVTLTLDDTDDLSTITSAVPPDLDLYRLSMPEAQEQSKPSVVVLSRSR